MEVAVFEGGRSLWTKISGRRGRPPPTVCARYDRPVNASQLLMKVFTQRNFVADFLREKPNFCTENGQFAFLRPPLGLRATYAVHLRLIGKLVVDFLCVMIELFRKVLSFCHNARVGGGRMDGQTDRQTAYDH